ncbi:uncharacterized protein LOC143906639 [Temnothorax americanus]|uniref:uncharacterized protein LOC143906639 n=1 Tax=Temnothorax americanus TaxID=1964332 RepID=UPI0040694371
MRKIGIEDNSRQRIMETYKKTKNVVKIRDKKTEEFWTGKGLRQGCPLSPNLFNLYIMNLEEGMEKGQAGCLVIGKEKFWTLSYADDIVLMATRKEELKKMMRRLKRYLEGKGLSLSPEKSKIMAFEKARGKRKKREWKWGGEDIEEVKEIKYLGYILQKNGGAENHIKDRMKKATIAMKRTWSIGERIFKEDFERRMKMFEALVEGVALYGAEIWGWLYKSRLDVIKRKYVKWILGLDSRTPNYVLAEEAKMKEIKVKAIRRAARYEEKARQSRKKIVQACIKDLERSRPKKEENKWEKKRRELIERAGMEKVQLRREMEAGAREAVGNLVKRKEEREKEERQIKIKESRYNSSYKEILTEELPKYLLGKKKKNDRMLIARYRCGSEVKGSQHWREEEDRRCRICQKEEENIEHILKECEATKSEIQLKEFLGKEGKRLEVMKKIERVRKEAEEREGWEGEE